MPSVTSYFNRGLFRHNLLQYWPLWSFYTALWLFILPVTLYSEYAYQQVPPTLLMVRQHVLNMLPVSLGMTAGFAVLFAMATGAFLCASRSVNFFHSLPLRREAIFCTNIASGLLFFVLPHAIIAGLTLLIEAMLGTVDLYSLAIWFAVSIGLGLFFYAFAVCITLCTGQLLAIPVFYLVFNFLVIGLEALVRNLSGLFLYGWTGNNSGLEMGALSPIYYLAYKLRVVKTGEWVNHNTEYQITSVSVTGLDAVAVYSVVGLLLLGIALLLYRRRTSESAGDTIAFSKMKPIFRWGVTLCTGLSLGQGIYALIWMRSTSRLVMSLCVAFSAMVGFWVAEMLLRKTVRLPKKSLRNSLVAAILTMGLAFGLSYDLTGYETEIPDAEDVLSYGAQVSYNNWNHLSDMELLDEVLALHASIIADKEEQELRQRQSQNQPWDGEMADCFFTYQLKDGTTLRRSYWLYLDEESMQKENSLEAQLYQFVSQPAVHWNDVMGNELYHLLLEETLTPDMVQSGSLYLCEAWYEKNLSATQSYALLMALQQDVQMNCYSVFIEDEDEVGSLYLNFLLPAVGAESLTTVGTAIEEKFSSIILEPGMTHTMEALQELGI